MLYKALLKPLLFQLEAESAHGLTAQWAQKTTRSDLLASIVDTLYNYQSPVLGQSFLGHFFRNPVGLAPGFDKNGYLVQAIENMGMGFTEVGSITARSSTGNAKPRAFRLPQDRALINRMGLNNEGVRRVVDRLQQSSYSIPLGINIAKTHSPDIMGDKAIRDYQSSYLKAWKAADYITLNISCPNTAEGKTFEDPVALKELLATLFPKDAERTLPTLVKFSPDLDHSTLEVLVGICESYPITGYIACNTSSSRSALQTSKAKLKKIGPGGVSGRPLAPKATQTIQWIRKMAGPQPLIIGVGGIDSFDAALQMLKAGANLLQLYTGLVYEGPGLVKQINRGLVQYLEKRKLPSLKALREQG